MKSIADIITHYTKHKEMEKQMTGMTNAAAMGYGILALKRMMPLLSQERLREFENLMREELDMTTEEEAEQTYNSN